MMVLWHIVLSVMLFMMTAYTVTCTVFIIKLNREMKNSTEYYKLQLSRKKVFGRTLDFIRFQNAELGRQYETQLAQRDAELRALQNQINPHFLYNTLDTIRGKAYEEKAFQTAEMTELLAQMFRYTIGQNQNLVTIEEELEDVKTYIAIQQYRFNVQYGLQIDIEDKELLAYHLPRLTIQPIVENSVKYGFSRKGSNMLTLHVFRTRTKTMINIIDNGKGMSAEQNTLLTSRLTQPGPLQESIRANSGTGVALVNVNARIRLSFGEQYGLSVQSIPDVGTKVTITLPPTTEGSKEQYESRTNIL